MLYIARAMFPRCQTHNTRHNICSTFGPLCIDEGVPDGRFEARLPVPLSPPLRLGMFSSIELAPNDPGSHPLL